MKDDCAPGVIFVGPAGVRTFEPIEIPSTPEHYAIIKEVRERMERDGLIGAICPQNYPDLTPGSVIEQMQRNAEIKRKEELEQLERIAKTALRQEEQKNPFNPMGDIGIGPAGCAVNIGHRPGYVTLNLSPVDRNALMFAIGCATGTPMGDWFTGQFRDLVQRINGY